MATLENSCVLFSRLCVELFHEIPLLPSDGEFTTFEGQFLRRCQIEFENSSPKTEQFPLVYVDESTYWRFIKTVRVLAEIFKNTKITETTRKNITKELMNPICPPERNTDAMNLFLCSIGKLADLEFSNENLNQLVQSSLAVELERKYKEEVKLRKEAEDALAKKEGEVEMVVLLLESYKKELGKVQLEAQALGHKYDAELQLRKEAEDALAIKKEEVEVMEGQLESYKEEQGKCQSQVQEALEQKHETELKQLRTETQLSKELEGIKQLHEACIIEQDNLKSQVLTWRDMYDQESTVRKETEDALSKEKQELETVKGLLEASRQEADVMRQERDNDLKTAQELMTERQPLSSFVCPITQDVMKDPHVAADGFTYEAESIKKWLSTGHKRSPMTNLQLAHVNLIPNRTLRSAIQELV
ncbi:PREDICTED: putative U-box domain-containing protein 58 [Camelina sativa]|uniref:RING-type E3 ubiquitin transferase n=1 Tax=Camelina sativa TaxID=90675 RepID=A0ABM1R6H5_CAMSA|nr:PREDICTED: putative U-box domain-containing protein 58 [Camelina sativa]